MNRTRSTRWLWTRLGLGLLLVTGASTSATAGMHRQGKRQRYSLRRKLQMIVLPHVKFDKTPVREAFAELQKMSKKWDADGAGINFLLHLPDGDSSRVVSLNMHRMSVEDLTRYACMSADLSHRVERSAVVIAPKVGDAQEALETRFYDINAGADLPGAKEKDPKMLQGFFEQTGIKFPVGSSVSLSPRGARLVVTNTPGNLQKFERVLIELGITTFVHTGPGSD